MGGPGGSAKRLVDLCGAACGLVVLSPVLLVLGILCRLIQGRPVLHHAQRAGLGEVPFTLLKLRTMDDRRDANGRLLPDGDRLTTLGRWLRRTSLDELPQLWNVLRGDMSLVGPRPLPVAYLERYTAEERRRHAVRPGITGWAQVQGRNTLPWEDRLALDVWYVDHRSLWLDARILVRTVGRVVRGDGVSAPDHATMGELRPERAVGLASEDAVPDGPS